MGWYRDAKMTQNNCHCPKAYRCNCVYSLTLKDFKVTTSLVKMQIFPNNSKQLIWKNWPKDVGIGTETKAPERKRKWRCFSMRQRSQFQVTFYINGKILCLAARVQGCQPVWPTRLFTLKRPKQKKSKAPFFPKKMSCSSCKPGEFVSAMIRAQL